MCTHRCVHWCVVCECMFVQGCFAGVFVCIGVYGVCVQVWTLSQSSWEEAFWLHCESYLVGLLCSCDSPCRKTNPKKSLWSTKRKKRGKIFGY